MAFWAMSTTENAMTAHLVLQPGMTAAEEEVIKNKLRHKMIHYKIDHLTVEIDKSDS
jgi:cobalt-zinc-cadmium efflux system protein